MAYYGSISARTRTFVATSTLRKRLFYLGVLSVFTIATLSFMLRFTLGQNALPIFNKSRPSVTLRQGTFLGIEVQTEAQPQEQFRGIPYGRSTAGENRFGPPVPISASTETFDASNYGEVCPAGSYNPHGENCLSVNIYRPKKRIEDKKLPVLVHLYGGAFNFGAGMNRNIEGMVAWSAEPFIGVSFNYRVGALGFLASKFAKDEGLLNAGLKDQALLFKWVQENIAAFGGDPNDVTVMGQSAGAHSIGHHVMRNPIEKPLFHKAIIESGGATARACYQPTNPLPEQQFVEFLTILGCQDVPSEELLTTLRNFTSEEIKEASEKIYKKYNPSVRWPWQPVIDGEGGIIPIPPIDSWNAGKWHKIPILTGFNTNEGAAFTPKGMKTSKEFTKFFETLLPGLSKDDLVVLDKLYPDPLTDSKSKYVETRPTPILGPEFKRAEQAYGHFAYVAPVRHTAHFAATAGKQPVYLYHYAMNDSIIGGADHGTHSGFPTYDHDVVKRSATIKQVSGLMHAYWTSFITTGDPNKIKGRFADRPEWPVYKAKEGKLIIFGEGNDESAGGKQKGTPVRIKNDDWAVKESEYWWARTSKFEL